MTDTARSRVLGDGQRAAALAAGAGMALAAMYGLVISYLTVRDAARVRGLPLPELYPLGIEGGFVAVLALDLLLTWVGRPIGWLRQVARLLAVAAVGINAAAGWDHGALAAAMHALPPVILIACVEALRTLLLRHIAAPDAREPIPRMRWVLAPVSTAAMWRRMVLWQITAYTEALDADLARREAVYGLRRAFGRRWRREIPADVAYRLTAGVRITEALTRTRDLLAAEDERRTAKAIDPAPAEGDRPDAGVSGEGQPLNPAQAQERDIAELSERGVQALAEFLDARPGEPAGGVAELPPRPAHFDGDQEDNHGRSQAEEAPTQSARAARRQAGEATRERIARYLAEHPGAPTTEVAKALHLGRSTVRRWRRHLKNNGNGGER